MNPHDLDRLTLEATRSAVENEGASIRELERRLSKGKNWLSNRLLGNVQFSILDLYLLLDELDINPLSFFQDFLPRPKISRVDGRISRAGAKILEGIQHHD